MLACLARHVSAALRGAGAERQLLLLAAVCEELSFIGLWEGYHPAVLACNTPALLQAETAMLSAAGSLASMLSSSAAYLDSLGGGRERHGSADIGSSSGSGNGSSNSGGGDADGDGAAAAAQHIFTGSYRALFGVTVALDHVFEVHTLRDMAGNSSHAYKQGPAAARARLALALARACTQLACAVVQPRLWRTVQLSPAAVAAARGRWGAVLAFQEKDPTLHGLDRRLQSATQDRAFAECAEGASLPARYLLGWVYEAGFGFLAAAGRYGLLRGLEGPTAVAVLRSLLGMVEVLVSRRKRQRQCQCQLASLLQMPGLLLDAEWGCVAPFGVLWHRRDLTDALQSHSFGMLFA